MSVRFRRLRRGLLMTLLLTTVAALAGLVHTAWPFVVYPAQTLAMPHVTVAPAEAISVPVAGVAEVDITPPIGIPKFGFSAWSRPADGFRTRLKARALYLHLPGQTPLALVTLDLGAGSQVLHRQVAARIADTGVAAHALLLQVTHTHAGPGQYLDSDFYNTFGSNLPGFDAELTAFLAERIAAAVQQAQAERRPVQLAVGTSTVRGWTRNRSLAAWARNHDMPESALTDDLAYQAVNPTLTMLRVDLQGDDGQFHPAGAFSSYSIHGTAIPPFTGPWHADVWHALSRSVSEHIASRHPGPFTPVHGVFQGTHADNSPDWHTPRRGHPEAERIGHGLADTAIALYESLGAQLVVPQHTAVASRELDLLALGESQRGGLCERGIVGAAVVGSASGDEVFPISSLPFIRPGQPAAANDHCQGVKHWMLSRLQTLLPADRLPFRPVFQVARIDDLVLINLPWEVTLEAGRRMEAAISEVLPEGHWKLLISSLATGYFGYATTPEEYSIQHYEGGHTLYGPGTVPFIARHSAALAADLWQHGEVAELDLERPFTLRSRSYWPATRDTSATRQWLQAPRFHDRSTEPEPFWSLQLRAETADQLALHQPLLSIECRSADASWQRCVSDDSGDLAITLLAQRNDHGDYRLQWFNPPVAAAGEQYRLVVAARGNRTAFASEPFPQR